MCQFKAYLRTREWKMTHSGPKRIGFDKRKGNQRPRLRSVESEN